MDGINKVLKLVERNIEDDLFRAYKAGWRKSKVYAKKTDFHGLNSEQIEEYFDKWFKTF